MAYKHRYTDEIATKTANLVLSWNSNETESQKHKFIKFLVEINRIDIEFSLDFLSSNEQLIQGILCSKYVTKGPMSSTGILWLTSHRIIHVCGSQIHEYSSLAAPVSFLVTGRIFKNALIKFFISTNLARGDVHVTTYDCPRYPHDVVENFVKLLNSELEQRKQAKLQNNVLSKTANTSNFIADIERLGVMRQQGLLSEEEFKLAKNKLLGID